MRHVWDFYPLGYIQFGKIRESTERVHRNWHVYTGWPVRLLKTAWDPNSIALPYFSCKFWGLEHLLCLLAPRPLMCPFFFQQPGLRTRAAVHLDPEPAWTLRKDALARDRMAIKLRSSSGLPEKPRQRGCVRKFLHPASTQFCNLFPMRGYLKKKIIGIYLTYNVVLALGVHQRGSVIRMHLCILFHILFLYRPSLSRFPCALL